MPYNKDSTVIRLNHGGVISEFDATNAGTAEMGINAALMLGES